MTGESEQKFVLLVVIVTEGVVVGITVKVIVFDVWLPQLPMTMTLYCFPFTLDGLVIVRVLVPCPEYGAEFGNDVDV